MATPTREELRLLARSLTRAREGLELLLTVATDHEPAAREAWKMWCKLTGEPTDAEQGKLVPYVLGRLHAPLADLGSVEDWSVRIEALSLLERTMWERTDAFIANARDVAEVLQTEDIATIAIKGLGLKSMLGDECGPRTLATATLALPKAIDDTKWKSGCSALEAEGFIVLPAPTPHAVLVARSGDVYAVTICRTVMKQDPRFDAMEWAKPVEGEPFLALDPTAALLVTAVSGLTEGGGTTWPIDLVALIRTGEVNWGAVEYHAETRGMTLLVEAALLRACLVNESTSGGHADLHRVPDGVLTRLGAVRASHLEALELVWLMRGERRGAQAGRLLRELRERSAMVTPEGLRKHEGAKGLAWDARWAKEWA